jgi:hypothetical protein
MINPSGYTNYIIQGKVNTPIDGETNQTCRSYYPICTKTKYADVAYSVGVDKSRTLRNVVYNADGRNPQYSKQLGVGLTFENLTNKNRVVIWEPHGGIIGGDLNEGTPSFSLGKTISVIPFYEDVEQLELR